MLPTVALGKAARELLPRVAAVGRAPDSPLRTARLESPGLAVHLPEAGVEDPGIARVHAEVRGSRLVADEEDLLPCLAAVSGAEDAALGVGSPHVALRGDIDEVRVLRMNSHARDLVRVLQTDVLPGLPAVGGLVDAVAVRDVAADGRLPHPGVDHVGVGLGDADRADRPGLEVLVRHRRPVRPAVRGLPDAASGASEVVNQRLPAHARDRRDAPAAKRPDVAELHPLVRLRDRHDGRRFFLRRRSSPRREASGGNEHDTRTTERLRRLFKASSS